MNILTFFATHPFVGIIVLHFLAGVTWLLSRLGWPQNWRTNWDIICDYDKSTFGRWTPIAGILLGFLSFALMVRQVVADTFQKS
ncbi:MAG: hypothetical protein WC761_03350 [Candidatus Paceibacterota bacterium]|jgi:hypothetical protein